MGAFVSRRDPDYIYIIRECYPQYTTQRTQFYKVGKTKDHISRLANLQTGNVRKLEYAYLVGVNSMRLAENIAHQRLNKYRVNYGGGREWFEIPNNEINEVISNLER